MPIRIQKKWWMKSGKLVNGLNPQVFILPEKQKTLYKPDR